MGGWGSAVVDNRVATSLFVPLAPGQMLPPVPGTGSHTDEDIARLLEVRRIEGRLVTVGPSPAFYAFYRGTLSGICTAFPFHELGVSLLG